MNKIKSALLVVCLFGISQAHAAGNDVSNNCPGNSCHGGQGGEGGAGGTGTGIGVGVGVGYANSNSNSAAVGTGGNATGGSATAFGGNSDVDVRNSSTNLNTNSNSNVGVNTNTSVNGQAQSTENANNSTNNTSVNVAGDSYEARRIPVATAYSNAPLPSATCRSGGALGVQSSVLGISLGGDRAVDTCEINEASRIAFAIGQADMSVELLCQNKWAKKTSQCQALVAAE
jgi:hypothetical protein